MLLRKLCLDGLSHRYSHLDDEIVERIGKEIEVITQKQYLSYFLITWDFISYARAKGYFYVGRGSGANSIVAYLLRITNVDPLQLDLYFERFINLERIFPILILIFHGEIGMKSSIIFLNAILQRHYFVSQYIPISCYHSRAWKGFWLA